MKSVNFEILRPRWPELAELGGFAEAYAHADPASPLVKLRLYAENVTKDLYRDLRLPKPDCRERVFCPAFVAREMSGMFAACSMGGACGGNWCFGVSS